MLTSLDGKIDGAFFGAAETAPALHAYGELRGYYNCPATLYGTTTMLGGYADGPVSYTHLDVYKRQSWRSWASSPRRSGPA